MAKTWLFLCALLTLAGTLPAQQPGAVTGTWLNEEKDAKVEIYKTGDTYSGKLIWGKLMFEPDGITSKTDFKNKDADLRKRPLHNLVLLSGFSFKDGEWTGGVVYDPNNGKTYSSVLRLKDNDLHLRGYIGTPLFGRTTVWTRTR